MIKKDGPEQGFESNPNTLPQCMHIAVTVVVTMCTGKSTEYIYNIIGCSILGVAHERGNR